MVQPPDLTGGTTRRRWRGSTLVAVCSADDDGLHGGGSRTAGLERPVDGDGGTRGRRTSDPHHRVASKAIATATTAVIATAAVALRLARETRTSTHIVRTPGCDLQDAPVLRAERDGERYVVTTRLTGDFPGSPADLDFKFMLANDKIASLEIG